MHYQGSHTGYRVPKNPLVKGRHQQKRSSLVTYFLSQFVCRDVRSTSFWAGFSWVKVRGVLLINHMTSTTKAM